MDPTFVDTTEVDESFPPLASSSLEWTSLDGDEDADGVLPLFQSPTTTSRLRSIITNQKDDKEEETAITLLFRADEDQEKGINQRTQQSTHLDQEGDESDGSYVDRVYGTTTKSGDILLEKDAAMSSTRRWSRQMLQRRRSSLQEALPETPAGWTVLLTTVVSAICGYELQLQKQLTAPPIVYGQCLMDDPYSPAIADIYQRMLRPRQSQSSSSSSSTPSVLLRPIRPSMFVGTRSAVSSAAAYLTAGPAEVEHHVRFREILTMPADGATIALDWELPDNATTTDKGKVSALQRQDQILHGPIDQPVVLILHGINNHAGFGYVRSMMRECVQRNWIAVGLNFRGCGGIPLTTPRTYNGAYTGDIRGVVQSLSRRLQHHQQPLFLVGNSLGANLVAKYLGEEGKSGTLPACVAGGVTMGNPMAIDLPIKSRIVSSFIAAGAKRGLYSVYRSLKSMEALSTHFSRCMYEGWTAVTLADYDRAMAPIFCRNDPVYPFAYRIGYESAEAYWKDASSYRQTRFVSVPFLQLVAKDDFLVGHPFRGKLAYNVTNPNVMVMETTCGGHLGWQEAPPNGWGVVGSSWADTAMADFIQAVLESYREKQQFKQQGNNTHSNDIADADANVAELRQRDITLQVTPRLRSRL